MWLLIFIIPLLIWLDIYLFKVYYKLFFNDKDDFKNSMKYAIRPDIFSLFKGEYLKDRFAEAKLSGLVFFSIATIVIEFLVVSRFFNLV